MKKTVNPFSIADVDRHELWEMLVRRDITAFAAQDWTLHEVDFLKDEFFGVNSGSSGNPNSWTAAFGDLNSYAANWVAFAKQTAETEYAEDPVQAHFRATTLRDIEINGAFAIAHKKFDGTIALADGGVEILNWQTIYFCRRRSGRWYISGFVGYLPNPMGIHSPGTRPPIERAARRPAPQVSGDNGLPGSAVVEITPGTAALASGHSHPDAAVDFASRTAATILNCLERLADSGYEAGEVFKISALVTDIEKAGEVEAALRALLPALPAMVSISHARLAGSQDFQLELWAAHRR